MLTAQNQIAEKKVCDQTTTDSFFEMENEFDRQ
jgi:hypothetical protein